MQIFALTGHCESPLEHSERMRGARDSPICFPSRLPSTQFGIRREKSTGLEA